MVAERVIVALEITDTVSLPSSATYTFPAPFATAIPVGVSPTGIVASTSPVVASNAATMCVDEFVTHSTPCDSAIAGAAGGVSTATGDIAVMSDVVLDVMTNAGDGALRALEDDATALTVAM